MKKRMICFLLTCLTLVGLLAACGEGDAEEMTAVTIATEETTEATAATEATEATEKKNEPASKATEAPTETVTEAATEAYRPPAETPTDTEAPPATDAPTEAAPDLRALALGCCGCDVSVLYAAIGYPNGSSYAGSCMGDGEDGELYYNGFTVYTYREDGVETVMSVY